MHLRASLILGGITLSVRKQAKVLGRWNILEGSHVTLVATLVHSELGM
jgi:hypothetical protein